MKYIIQLDNKCWVTDGEGDPPRTLIKSNARQFSQPSRAFQHLEFIKKQYPFRDYSMSEIKEIEI